MDPFSGDESFEAQPRFDLGFELTQPKIEQKTAREAMTTLRHCTRGLNVTGRFAIGVSLTKATNMSALVERGRKREVTLVLGNNTSVFETSCRSIPTFTGATQSAERSEHCPTTPP